MKLGFGSNLLSLNAQRRLSEATNAIGQNFERLSSGLRINRAADDPAGLGVSEALNAKSRVLSQAQRNVNDATSFLQVADGAVNSISLLMTRMTELAEQASNGIFSSDQRSALNEEYVALDKEINRITASTSFNGISLLKGGEHDGSSEVLVNTGNASGTLEGSSADGRYVLDSEGGASAFSVRDTTTGALVPNGNLNPAGRVAMDGLGNVVLNDITFGQTDVYLFDVESGLTTTLTASGNVSDAGQIAISADGSTIAFSSFTHYVDGGTLSDGTTSGNQRLFSYDVASGVFTDYGTDIANVGELTLSADGSKIAFRSNNDLTGGNADANQELFVIDRDDPSKTITQLTDSTLSGSITIAGVSNDGRAVINTSRDLTGGNPTGVAQLFSVAAGGGQQQLTSLVSATGLGGITLNAQGTTAYFTATEDITGENPNATTQGFRLDLDLGELTQVTNFTSSIDAFQTRFSEDGSKLFYTTVGSTSLVQSDLSKTKVSLGVEAGFGGTNGIIASIGDIRGSLSGLGSYVLTSQEYAQAALDNMSANVDTLASIRGVIGASLSRLSSANALLGSQTDEFRAASSRITDIDVASETAKLVANQIRTQSIAAILAQANQQPRIALQLLNIGASAG